MEDCLDFEAKCASLKLWYGTVPGDWLDYNGHMTEHRYLQVFGESSDALYSLVGVDFTRAHDGAYFRSETHIRHLAEAKCGTNLHTETEILGFDAKRLHLYHRLIAESGELLATGEHLSVHVRSAAPCDASPETLAKIAEYFSQKAIERAPEGSGSVLRKALATTRINGSPLRSFRSLK